MKAYERLRAVLMSGLDANSKLVAVALVDHMSDRQDFALCGVERIAVLTSLSPRSVQRVLKDAEGRWLTRGGVNGARVHPMRILWGALPTPDSVAPVQDSHPCQPVTGDNVAPVPTSRATGDSLTPDPCQICIGPVTGCHPKPTNEPTKEANQGSQPEYMPPPPPAPLFAQPPAPEVAAPAPKPKPPPADEAEALAVWTAWKETHRGCKATPPADVAKLIRAALKEHGAETVIAVVRWTQTADHSRARYLRGERNGQMVPKEAYGLDTIMRHVGSYDALRVADEAAPAASPRMSALPPGMKPRGPVVLDADTGRPVAPEPPPQKSRGLDLMLDAAERLRKQRELEEEEDRQQQQQEAYDA